MTLDKIPKTDRREFRLDAETAIEDKASETEYGTGAKENSAVTGWRYALEIGDSGRSGWNRTAEQFSVSPARTLATACRQRDPAQHGKPQRLSRKRSTGMRDMG